MGWSYSYIDHTADIAVDLSADSLSELFMSAACAMREAISDTKINDDSEQKHFSISEPELEILLVSFLSELNFLFQSKKWIVNSIQQIEINHDGNNWNLKANILGGNFDSNKHKLKSEIKAVTFHQMEIKNHNGQFSTRIVFDI